MISENLKLKAVHAAIESGLKILEIYNNPDSDFEVEIKSDNSPLTIADRISHNIIVERLGSTRIPILSEEGSDVLFEERLEWDLFWLVDPIDGTKEFIKKNGEFTVNIALIKNREPIFGVIYVPVQGLLYVGDSKKRSWKLFTDNPLIEWDRIEQIDNVIPNNIPREKYRVVASKSFMNKETEDFIESLKKDFNEIEIVSKGSSLKICMIADGSADIYPRLGPTMEWDVAAGHAIVLGAGKKIFLVDKRTPLFYNKKELRNPYFIVK